MDNTEIELKFRAHKFNKKKFLSLLKEFFPFFKKEGIIKKADIKKNKSIK